MIYSYNIFLKKYFDFIISSDKDSFSDTIYPKPIENNGNQYFEGKVELKKEIIYKF